MTAVTPLYSIAFTSLLLVLLTSSYPKGASAQPEKSAALEEEERGIVASVPFATCKPDTCQNGGTCHQLNDGITCHCPTGFVGNFCQQGEQHLPNLVL